MTLYGKDDVTDLTPDAKRALKEAVEREARQRARRRKQRRELEMAKGRKYRKSRKKRSVFRELMSGVRAMRDHREGRVTLRTHEVEPITVPAGDMLCDANPRREIHFF